MIPRTVLLTLLVATLVLPSLPLSSHATHSDPWEPPFAPDGINLYGCLGQWAAVPFPRHVAENQLPPGFDTAKMVGNSPYLTWYGVFLQRCEKAILPDGSEHEDYIEAWHMLPIIPPAGYDPSPHFHVFVKGYMTNIPTASTYLEEWNMADDADGELVYEQYWGISAPGVSTASAIGPSFGLDTELVSQGNPSIAQNPFLMRAYSADADGEVRRGMDILIGEGRQSGAQATVTFTHGVPLIESWVAPTTPLTGNGIVYQWDHGILTQTMRPISFV